ncbi:MAG TPA: hypothetical protein VGK73_13890, partial [Polyangiaceae bacterium]
MTEPDLDALGELRELAASLRAHAEWLALSGATGLERGSSAPASPSVTASPPVAASPPVSPPRATAAPAA